MKYIKKFNTYTEYNTFKNSINYLIPNVSLIKEASTVDFSLPPTPPPIMAGDIVYWDNGTIKTTQLKWWKSSIGTPIGVVVIPEEFAPDGKIRIVSLNPADSNGNQSDSHVSLPWSSNGTDTSLPNYTMVPTTDNVGSTSTGSNGNGYLPSDNLTGTQSFVDALAKYNGSSFLIPSPYLGSEPNTEYYKELSDGNALSDFNGMANTQTLIALNKGNETANACWNYSDGISNLQWYLPAMGELGYLMPRFKLINESISAVGGVIIPVGNAFWSSTENSSLSTYFLNTGNGNVTYGRKSDYRHYRPFTILN